MDQCHLFGGGRAEWQTDMLPGDAVFLSSGQTRPDDLVWIIILHCAGLLWLAACDCMIDKATNVSGYQIGAVEWLLSPSAPCLGREMRTNHVECNCRVPWGHAVNAKYDCLACLEHLDR
jgi:hypothetical protein